MKVKTDEELSILHQYTFGVAKLLGNKFAEGIIEMFQEAFLKDEKFQQLDHSGAVSAILKTNSIIFIRVLNFAYNVGKSFPDSETNPVELFEEAIEGLRILTNIKEPDEKEYVSGIKKVKVQ